MKSQLNFTGQVEISTYDGMYTKGCTGIDYAKLIEGGAEPSKITKGKNAVQQAWANNVAGALCNAGYAWSTATAPQLCFESSYGALITSADMSSTFGTYEIAAGSPLDPPKTSIGMKNSSDDYAILDMPNAVSQPTATSMKAVALWFGISTTSAIWYFGILQSFVRAGSGSTTWRQLMAQHSQVVAMNFNDVTQVSWTISLA